MTSQMHSLPLFILLLLLSLQEQPCTSFSAAILSLKRQSQSKLFLYNFFPSSGGGGAAKAPTSTANRDDAACDAVKSAIKNPRYKNFPLIECEFPPLAALNKLGDGSLRSATEAEDANISFASKLCSKLGSPFGPKVNLVISSSASRSFTEKVQKKVKAASTCSVKDLTSSTPSAIGVFVFLTPSSKTDYEEARKLAERGSAAVIVNGLFKVSCD